MLAVLGPCPPEQVIVVLGTGSGKTLIVMVAISLAGAGTIVLILPTVALRGNIVGRLDEVGLRHYVWERESKRVAPVVIVSAEAACIDGFLDYAYRLVDRQQLDRIVIDECHLTITASSYWRSMAILAWHLSHNKLVRPRVVLSEEEKGAVIDRWIYGYEEDKWPVIMAMSALGPGFDYAYVRFIIYAGPLSIMIDFS
ncbi:hypothetical protein NW757_014255 [Fusarium falciforme]|nr:hypothetical protein NW757_014255 [Fusarium falciforme]